MSARIASYVMNPAEDVVMFGDDLAEGMWVLREDTSMRHDYGTEEEQLRGQRFMRVTRLRFTPGPASDLAVFIGEWVDGHQEVQRIAVTFGWIVKKDSLPATGAGEGQES